MLYIIPSPIGNLEDFTYRAVKLIPTLDYLLCEDTRKTRVLLQHYFPDTYRSVKLLPFHEKNETEKLSKVMDLLELNCKVGLISDAGTPTISDPGYRLVHECREKKLDVIALPGPSAVTTALSGCGLPSDRFTFIGYLPKKQGDIARLLTPLSEGRKLMGTIIAYESPIRLFDSLKLIQTIFGNIHIVIARELTKMFETYYSGNISEVTTELGKSIKGEITILFNLNE